MIESGNDYGLADWFSLLFRAEDIFEYRIKGEGESFARKYWRPVSRAEHFASVELPVHNRNGKHVWVGVSPRPRIGDSNPTHHHALWCDFASSVVDLGTVSSAVEGAGLPKPTMIVDSGRGYHAYWALERPLTSDEVSPYSKGLHHALPTDSTHDAARVMRVPGNINPRNGEYCRVVEYDPTLVYDIAMFPREDPTPRLDVRPNGQELPAEDLQMFVDQWIDGQKHNLAIGIAGYLRKNLHQSQAQALESLRLVHESAGFSWEDQTTLEGVVRDTYAKPLGEVAGTSILHEFGIIPTVRDIFDFQLTIKKPPTPTVRIIDFSKELKPQEFWVDGLVGPGLTTMWAAQPKTGKSLAVMQIGHALANGLPLWDFQTDLKPHPVLYFQGELSQGMVYDRARAMFPPGTYENSVQFAMTDKPEKALSLVQTPDVLFDLATDYDVVIIDPLSAFNSNDENSVTSVRETMAIFDTLKAQGKAVIIVHHTRKLETDRDGNVLPPSFSDLRGSSFWFSSVDAAALQWPLAESGNTRVKFMFRAAKERPTLTLYRDGVGFTSNREILRKSLFPANWTGPDLSEVN